MKIRFIAPIVFLFTIARLNAQSDDRMSMHCNEPPVTSVDDELARLSGETVRAKSPHLECIFSYMDDLGRRKEPRALPIIARYLDVANPRPAENFAIGRTAIYGGEYPAIEYILWFRKAALPVLKTTIENERYLSLEAKNAVLALMVIEAPDPPLGVKSLADASQNLNEPAKTTLLQAAQFAVESWQCHLIKKQCQQALEQSIQSNVRQQR